MAVVSGVPNFFNKTTLLGDDLDAGIGAIITQIGGIYFHLSGSGINTASNLDATNFASAPGFSNSQKQEPASRVVLLGSSLGRIFATTNDLVRSGTTAGFLPTPAWFPAIPITATAYAISFSYGGIDGAGGVAAGGTITMYINGRSKGVVLTVPSGGLAPGGLLKADLDISLAPDDIVALLLSSNFVTGSVDADGITGAQIGLWCRFPHVGP